MEWKWSKGESYQKSSRIRKNIDENNDKNINVNESKYVESYQSDLFSNNTQQAAIYNSLNHDENTWDLMNPGLNQEGFKVSNKREELDLKISDRQLVQQCGYNPFLGNDNYLSDIDKSDKFLKPVNTTQGLTKEEFNEEYCSYT